MVVDASAIILILLDSTGTLLDRLAGEPSGVDAPYLLDLEVAHAFRRLSRQNAISDGRAERALRTFTQLPISRHPHEPLLPRVWELRANWTAYDASYLALAERLETPLLTHDGKFAGAPGHRARVELV